MVEAVVMMGDKGQILIPKLLRDQFSIFPGQPAVIEETEEGILIKKTGKDPIELFEETANKIGASKKNITSIKHEYESRMKKAGLKL